MNTKIELLKEEINSLKKQAAIKKIELNRLQSKLAEEYINEQKCGTFEMFHRGYWLPILCVMDVHEKEFKIDENSIYHLEIHSNYWPSLKVETEKYAYYEKAVVPRIAALEYIRRKSDKKPILDLI